MALEKRADFEAYILRLTSNARQSSRIRLKSEEDELTDAVDSAIDLYSDDRPSIVRFAIDGDGTAFSWVLEDTITPSGTFESTFSHVTDVRISSDAADDRLEDFLEPEADYEVEEQTDGKHKLKLFRRTPGTTENVEVFFTTRHTVTSTATTIPLRDRRAFCYLVASYIYDIFADRSASDFDAETGEAGDLADLTEKYEKRATVRMKQYLDHIHGQSDRHTQPVGIRSTWRSRPMFGAARRFSHNFRSKGRH